MKRMISFLLVLAMLAAMLPQISFGVFATANEHTYCNGTDYFVTEGGDEYFINSDDEDRLYKITSGSEELVLDEHVILLVFANEVAYLVVYRDEECKLVDFNVNTHATSDVYTFPDIVSNIALKDNELLYTLDGAAYSLNLSTMSSTVVQESGVAALYFDNDNSLHFLSVSGIEMVQNEGTNEAQDTRGTTRGTTSYTPRLTAPATDNPYYTTLNIFHNAGYGMAPNIGNCTCYAFGRSYENLGTEPKLSHGNAGEWYAYNKNNGYYSYGSSPVLGAVAVWTKSGGAGHVAIVEVINGDSVTTSESGWKSFYFKTVTRSASNSNFSASSAYSFQGFIYVLGQNVVTGPPASIPQNVRVAQKAANKVGVSWDAATNATSYDVYLIQSPYAWEDIKYSVSVSADYHYAELWDVEPGEYMAFVIARPNDNYSAQSEWVSITVEQVGVPQNIVVARRSADSIGVSWDAVPFATSYDVYMIQSPYAWADIKYSVNVSSDYKYAILDGIASGEYRVFVIARPNDNFLKQSEWKPVNIKTDYTITFDPVGGNCTQANKTVTYGQTYGQLPIPQKNQYTFDGWYTAEIGGSKKTADSTVNLLNDQTLYD